MNTISVRPTKKSLRRQNTMVRIIDGAITVFREKGYEGANLADITGAAGVAAGSLKEIPRN